MATIHRLPAPEPADADTLLARLVRLLRLEMELGLAEARDLLVSAAIAVAVAIPAAVALIASIVVLIAGAFAPLFGARWQHFIIAGGGVFLLSLATLAWSAWRVKTLRWPTQTVNSFQENWRWLAAQFRSRLTLR